MPEWLTVEFGLTVLLMFGLVGLAGFASHKSGQPYDVERPNRLPWRLILIVVAFLAAMCLVHLINLFGYETGVDKGLLGRR